MTRYLLLLLLLLPQLLLLLLLLQATHGLWGEGRLGGSARSWAGLWRGSRWLCRWKTSHLAV
jgi:hypothetical protein